MDGSVAMVFKDNIPTTYMGKNVYEGDSQDLRFLDPMGSIIGLVAKGTKGKSDESGFVIEH
jgi:hypothetical protein